jgi:RNA-binding protein NOB1
MSQATAPESQDEGEWEDAEDDDAVEDLTQSISQVLLSPEDPAPTNVKPFSYASTLAKATAPPPTEPDVPAKKSIAELQAEEAEEQAEESAESDGEGEWITPSNVSHHKSIDMGLIPALNPEDATPASTAGPSSEQFTAAPTTRAAKRAQHKIDRARALALANGDSAEDVGIIKTACMTGDYAVQNVLLQMGLKLVGEGGKRIGKVKSWVLRCHACFK